MSHVKPVSDLFKSIPPVYFSSAVSPVITKLYRSHSGMIYDPSRNGGQISKSVSSGIHSFEPLCDPLCFPTTIFFVGSHEDPLIPHLYQRYIILFSAQWVISSFLADTVLSLGDFKIMPWEYSGDTRFIPPKILSFQSLSKDELQSRRKYDDANVDPCQDSSSMHYCYQNNQAPEGSQEFQAPQSPSKRSNIARRPKRTVEANRSQSPHVKQERGLSPVPPLARSPKAQTGRVRAPKSKINNRHYEKTARPVQSLQRIMLPESRASLTLKRERLLDTIVGDKHNERGYEGLQLGSRESFIDVDAPNGDASVLDGPGSPRKADKRTALGPSPLRPYIPRPSDSPYKFPPVISERATRTINRRLFVAPHSIRD